MPHHTIAVVQARIGSSRLPGKVLMDFAGESVLSRVARRVAAAERIDRVVIATSVASQDDAIESLCEQLGVACFRGSENDVLDRFVRAAAEHEADWVVRVNADNPFLAPEYVDELVDACRAPDIDYASYRVGDRPAMLTAAGFFAELISRECLDRAGAELERRDHREHVTLGIYQSPERFRVRFLDAPEFAADPRLRLTLDTPEDLELLRSVAVEAEQPAESQQQSGAVHWLTAEALCRVIAARGDWLGAMQQLNLAQKK